MSAFNTLSKQLAVALKPEHCVGYWAADRGLDTGSIEQNPMHMASFYKDTGN